MKKLLSVLLAAAMLLTVIAVPAFAVEDTYVAYYVGNTVEGETVTGLVAGEVYAIDRMPEAVAPNGQYFVGWADSTGNIVTKDGLTLAEGENKLTAVYKSFAAETEVDLTKVTSASEIANIGYIKNGEYLGQVSARSSGAPKVEYVTDEETGESYLQVTPGAANSGGTGLVLVDKDGDVIQGKWSTAYKIEVIYRIPENEGTASLQANFGGKIYDATKSYDQAPRFLNQYGNALGLVKLGNYWSASSEPALTYKWHDNGGYFYRFGASVENAATTEDWQTLTFSNTTGAQDANYLPLFIVGVNVSANTVAQKILIKSIKVIDTTAASVEYYVGDQLEYTDTAVIDEAYIPNRAPLAAAPEGKYFAGWTDEEGNYVLDDSFVAKAGVNKLYASYVDYIGKVNANLNFTTATKVAIGSVYNDEYLNYADADNGYAKFEYVEEDDESYLALKNDSWDAEKNSGWTSRVYGILRDENDAAYQLKPGASYDVTITYKVPRTAGSLDMAVLAGTALENRASLPGASLFGVAKTVAPLVSTDDPSRLPVASAGWTYVWNKNGHHHWVIGAASENWVTATYSFTAPADFTGFLPTLMLSVQVPARTEEGNGYVYIKDITIKDKSYVEPAGPATVTYYVGENLDATVEDLTSEENYVLDRMPTVADPEGKFFAGWANENGKLVLNATLEKGENKFTAVYKDKVSGEVNASLALNTLPTITQNEKTSTVIALPTTVNGEYSGYANYVGWSKIAWDSAEGFIKHTNTATWNQATMQFIHDADGVPFMAKPETSYQIEFTFRVPVNKTDRTKEAYDAAKAQGETYKPTFFMYMDVGFGPSIRHGLESKNGNNNFTYKAAAKNIAGVWHDHGPCRPFWSDIDETEWTTEVFTITTKTAEEYEAAGLLPIFTYYVSHPVDAADGINTQLDVKSIVIKEVISAVEYVEGDETVATIENLATGETYKVDRMPVGETPEGKYFAGWADENGILVGDIELVAGTNTLTAVYKDYPKTVYAGLDLSKLDPVASVGRPVVSAPAIINGEYNGYVSSTLGGWLTASTETVGEDNILSVKNTNDTYGYSTTMPLFDKDGAPIYAEANTTYYVTLTYKIPASSGNTRIMIGAGVPDDKRNTIGANNWVVSSYLGTPKAANGVDEHEKYDWGDNGPSLYYPAGETVNEWTTVTFPLTVKDAENKTLLFTLSVALAKAVNEVPSELQVKEILIEKPYAEVEYYVDGELYGDKVTDVQVADIYAPDRAVTAPSGKYFAGWYLDEACTGAPVKEIELGRGTTKLYAGFVAYPGKVVADINANTYALYPLNDGTNGFATSVAKNTSGYGSWTYTDGVAKHTQVTTWGQSSVMIITDENGVAVKAEENKTYKVSLKVKGDNTVADAINAKYPELSYAPTTGFNVGAGASLSYSAASGYGLAGGKGLVYKCEDGGTGSVKVDMDGEWHSVSYFFTTGEFEDGILPVIAIVSNLTGLPNVDGAAVTEFGYNSTEYKDIVVEEVTADAFASTTVGEAEASYIKIADDVKDGDTYKVVLRYKATAKTYISFMVADANDVEQNRTYIEGMNVANTQTGDDGYAMNLTTYVSTSTDGGEGDALYVYVIGDAADIIVLAAEVTKLTDANGGSLIGNAGVAMLADLAEDEAQALRYFFTYDSTNEGANIVIDGVEYKVTQRGFLFADASKVEGKIVSRDAAKTNKAITDFQVKNLSNCWKTEKNADGSDKVTFSSYVTNFASEDGTYNSSMKLLVKGYVVIEIYGRTFVLYADSTSLTVKEVADLLG